MVSILDDKCSLTCVAAQSAWYSPCVIYSRGRASARFDGGIIQWVKDWVCGKGFFECDFVNGM